MICPQIFAGGHFECFVFRLQTINGFCLLTFVKEVSEFESLDDVEISRSTRVKQEVLL